MGGDLINGMELFNVEKQSWGTASTSGLLVRLFKRALDRLPQFLWAGKVELHTMGEISSSLLDVLGSFMSACESTDDTLDIRLFILAPFHTLSREQRHSIREEIMKANEKMNVVICLDDIFSHSNSCAMDEFGDRLSGFVCRYKLNQAPDEWNRTHDGHIRIFVKPDL